MIRNDNRKYLLILPAFFWISIFIILPLIFVLLISFSEPIYGVPPYKFLVNFYEGEWSFKPFLENYKLLFLDSMYLKSFIDSVSIAAVSTLLTIVIAFPIAFQISQVRGRARAILLLAAIVPFWTSALLRIYAWIIILKPSGLINQLLSSLGLIDSPIMLINTKIAVVIGITYTYLPFMIFPIYNSIEKIDKNIFEAAKDLGASSFSIFYRVLLPLCLPGIIAGSILVFVPAIGEFLIPDLLGGDRSDNSRGNHLE